MNNDSEEYCKDGKKRFRELLCHPNYGLPVYIINHARKGEYILLRPDGVDLEDFFEKVYGDDDEDEPVSTRLTIDKDFVRDMLASADTEWDRKLLRVLLSSSRSFSELKTLGISCGDIGNKTAEVLAVIQQKSGQNLNALQAINENLGNKLEHIRSTIKEKQNIIEKYNDHWPAERLDDLRDDLQVLATKETEIRSLLMQEDRISKRKVQQMTRRKANKLSEDQRLGRRKLGGGRPQMLNEENERFILECIESKTTAHGRRHDEVMYCSR